MTRLLNFTRIQERRKNGVFILCLRMKERGGLYSSGGENINEMPFNES